MGDFKELAETFKTQFRADPALFVAMPRELRKIGAAAVDGDCARLNAPADGEGFVDPAPHVGVQAEVGVVGDADGFVDRVVGNDRADGPKDLLLADRVSVVDRSEDDGIEKEAASEPGRSPTACEDLSTPAQGRLHLVFDPVTVARADDRTHVRFIIPARPDLHRGDEGRGQFCELFVVFAGHDDSSRGAASLTRVANEAHHRRRDDLFEINPWENDVRRFAVELEHNPLQPICSLAHDLFAHRHRTGECHEIDVTVRGDPLPDVRSPDDEVDDARRNSGFFDALHQSDRKKRRSG